METMKILDATKLAAAMSAVGFTETDLAREMTRLANGKLRWSPQNVGGWTSGKYCPGSGVTPYIQAALGIANFSEIASPVEWPEGLPKPEKRKKVKKDS